MQENVIKRKPWDLYFIDIAKMVASRSTCLRIPNGIGAILVKNKRILSTGYTGSLPGLYHCTSVGCKIGSNGGCIRTVHAEINAITQAAQHGISINGADVYTTMSPCWDCFKALATSGIKNIYYWTEYRTIDLQKEFAAQMSIGLFHLSKDKYKPVVLSRYQDLVE